MKIKQFVTNSSTCNFVLLGYAVPIKRKSNEDFTLDSKRKVLEKFHRNINANDLTSSEVEKSFEELFSNQFPVIKINEEYGAPNSNTILIGPELFCWNLENDSDLMSISLEDLSERIEDVIAEYNFKEEPKLFFGSKVC